MSSIQETLHNLGVPREAQETLHNLGVPREAEKVFVVPGFRSGGGDARKAQFEEDIREGDGLSGYITLGRYGSNGWAYGKKFLQTMEGLMECQAQNKKILLMHTGGYEPDPGMMGIAELDFSRPILYGNIGEELKEKYCKELRDQTDNLDDEVMIPIKAYGNTTIDPRNPKWDRDAWGNVPTNPVGPILKEYPSSICDSIIKQFQ